MKLTALFEAVVPPNLSYVYRVVGPDQDDTNQLVAYRARSNIGPPRVQYVWIVNLRGQALCYITRRDSKWVHDNWDWTYFDRDVQTIMTRNNRQYLDGMIKRLIYSIKDAISAKAAEVVTQPIDPAMVDV